MALSYVSDGRELEVACLYVTRCELEVASSQKEILDCGEFEETI